MIQLLFLLIIPLVNADRVVQTNSGPIRGITTEKNVEAFLAIPFAEPPVGNLRFAKPIPKSPWKETYNAKEMPPACMQSMTQSKNFFNSSSETDEDCLFLNLWVPKTEGILKPVMVFIHGGGFLVGSSNLYLYDGSILAGHGDVIVASMNYRVGTLGFFSGFIDEAAGSMGMYDQILAIQWIKDNAKHFGGDPDNIVIFGESAGSWSVSMHLISPLSKHLFKRAILQSGATISPVYSDNNEALRMGCHLISKTLGCAENDDELNENPKSVVECMKKLPAEKFAEADEALFMSPAKLVPRVGDEFLPMNPVDMLGKGEFKDTEVLIGVTRDEGTIFIAFGKNPQNESKFGESIDANTFNETSVEEMIKSLTENEHNDKIVQTYLKKVKEESGYTYLNAVSDIVGDHMLTCPTVFHADFQSLKSSPVYFYLFDYKSPSSPFADWIGVPHFEEVQYVFGIPFLKTFSEHEEELSRDMMDMWVSFAKTGNPSIPGGLKWPKYTYEDPKYLIIGKTDKIGVRPDNYRCEAWRSLFKATIDEEIIRNIKNSD